MDFLTRLPADFVEQVLGILFLLLNAFVLPQIFKWLNLRNDDKRRVLVESALQAALKYGAAKVSPDYTKLVKDPALLQQLLDYAAVYAKSSVPDTMAKLGIPDEAVREKLEARILDFIETLAKQANTVSASAGSGTLGQMQPLATVVEDPQGELDLEAEAALNRQA